MTYLARIAGLCGGLAMCLPGAAAADRQPLTSLGSGQTRPSEPGRHYAVIRRGPIEMVVVDNSAVDDKVLPGHKAGYHGIGSLRHASQPRNLFVPQFSGLNFEHIHDGTAQPRELLFEPRHAPIELRFVSDHAVELYQPPTPHWGLESCMRYTLLEEGVIELAFECIPRRETFKNGYIGLFWASYIDQPESLDIQFLEAGEAARPAGRLVRARTPAHGVDATHLPLGDQRRFPHNKDFPLALVFGESKRRYLEPWYAGTCRGMLFAPVFRREDQVRFSQSPSGAGQGNPAWDFQWFIENYRVGTLYQLHMRVLYAPLEEPVERLEESGHPLRQRIARLARFGGPGN